MLSGIDGRINVHVTTRASTNEISGRRDGVLQVRVTAPPLEGRANAALEKLLAQVLHIAPSRVSVVVGASSRNKVIAVEGCSSEELETALSSHD